MDIICEIQQKYVTFSDKEKAIADYILSKPNTIKNTNIIDLAKLIGTSGATITRFTRKVGCVNFVEMKMKINASINEQEAQDTSFFASVYHHYQELVDRSHALIDKDAIWALVKEIKEAKRIYLYGVGSSGLSATEMMQRLLRMGFNVHCMTDCHMMIINSSLISKRDLVIGLSISGDTAEVVNSLKLCKKQGAKTGVITAFEKSPVTVFSDIMLRVYNPNFNDRYKFINSQSSIMYLIDVISAALLEDEKLSQNLQVTIDTILNT